MNILQTKNLKKYYGMEPNISRALDGVDFSVAEGEFTAVVGTSAHDQVEAQVKMRGGPNR